MIEATPSHLVAQSRGPGCVGRLRYICDRDLADVLVVAAVLHCRGESLPRRLALVQLGHARILVQIVRAFAGDLVIALVPTSMRISNFNPLEAIFKHCYNSYYV